MKWVRFSERMPKHKKWPCVRDTLYKNIIHGCFVEGDELRIYNGHTALRIYTDDLEWLDESDEPERCGECGRVK